jgi:hypothetical protein
MKDPGAVIGGVDLSRTEINDQILNQTDYPSSSRSVVVDITSSSSSSYSEILLAGHLVANLHQAIPYHRNKN